MVGVDEWAKHLDSSRRETLERNPGLIYHPPEERTTISIESIESSICSTSQMLVLLKSVFIFNLYFQSHEPVPMRLRAV